jgi:Polysaccharide pyruvyl transferase
MKLHIGHHFFGAGNLGDDLMLAGLIAGAREFLPEARFSCCIPFELEPQKRRFPEIDWRACTSDQREEAIAACDAWVGPGGSPFQSAQSRWFVEHLESEADLCRRHGKKMLFLGIGVQTESELSDPTVRRICAQAAHLWTRDAESASRLQAARITHVTPGADLSHLFLGRRPPPPAFTGRACVVANFDYGRWPGCAAALTAMESLGAKEHLWLAQERRALPGAELALHATLGEGRRNRWRLTVPDVPGAPINETLAAWPSAEWLLTARYHAAMSGAWAGSRIVVIATNEKLRAAARELGVPYVSPDAAEKQVTDALRSAATVMPPTRLLAQARETWKGFARHLRPER